MDGVYSCGYNVLLGRIRQTPADANTRSSREGTAGMRPEWRKANPESLTAAGTQGNAAAPKRGSGSCHHPLVNSQPFPSQQLQGWAALLFPSWDRGLCCRPSLGLWTVGAQSHRLWSSKLVRQAHSGNNYSFLSPGNKDLKYCITSFFQQNPLYLYSATQCIHYLHESLVLNSVTKWKSRW